MKVRILIAAVLCTSLGCGAIDDAPTGVEPAGEYTKPMLPAYETDWEKAAGKADQYDDFKNSNLDVYGVTAAPGVSVRPAAEWETVDAMLLAYNTGLPGGIKKTQVDIIAGAQDTVDIFVIYEGASAKTDLQNQCAYYNVSMDGVQWLNMNNDTIWMRDFGPISILSQGTNGWLDNRYYPNRVYDDATPTLVGDTWNKTVYRTPIDMEGGNFMCDTHGTCFHTQSIYWANGTSQDNVDQYFADYFGCTNKIVVNTMDGEGTGHIDMSHKIVTDSKVIVGEYGNEDQTNKQILDQNAQIIASAGFDVFRIPMPSNSDGVFRSYTNSLLVNGLNLWPVYSGNPDLEAEAAQVYQQVLPDFTHVPILSDEVITWAGAIHCVTMTSTQGQPGALEADPPVICDEWDCYPSGGAPTGCGDVTYEGCCDGDILNWCESDQIKQTNCNTGTCGWDAGKQFYNCGTDGAADPSGQAPKDCDGGCAPACAGKVCGGDGCGGSCGICPQGESCDQGQCISAPDQCDGITFEGCCAADTLTYCQDGEIGTMDCTAENPDNICGWFGGDSSNSAGYYCGPPSAVDAAGDPTGTFPLECPGTECVPDCDGTQCGGDGCGGLCGTCEGDAACIDGQCVDVDDLIDPCPGGTVADGDDCVPVGPAPDDIGLNAAEDEGGGNCSASAEASPGAGLLLALLGLLGLMGRRAVALKNVRLV